MRTNERPKRLLGYARVSSTEQALGTSLLDQQTRIREYAAQSGLKVDRFFVEAESGVHEKFERREELQALMASLSAGDLVLVDKVDRWSRDPEFTYRSIREIREKSARIFFVEEQIDPNTPEGDMMLGMRAVFAREEHKRIRTRTVGTRKLLKDKGLYAEGLVPLGYRRSLGKGEKGPEKNVLVPTDEAALVVEIFERAKNESLNALLDDLLRTHRERTWDKKRLNTMLRNRIYLGEVRDARGVWIKAKHPAIVSAELFAAVADALDRRRLGGRRSSDSSLTRDWLLRKIGRCASCDAKLSAVYGGSIGSVHAPKAYVRFYYSCSKKCGARLVPVVATDAATSELLLEHLIELREILSKAPKLTRHAVVDFTAQKARIAGKRERFLELFSDGTMTREELAKALVRLDVSRTRIEAQEAAQARRNPLADPAARRTLMGEVATLRRLWPQSLPLERRKILERLATAVRVARDAVPTPEWLTPEKLLSDPR